MSGLATKYEFKDKRTDVGIKTFTDVIQNTVYNLGKDIESSLLGMTFKDITNLDSLTGKLGSVIDTVKNMPDKLAGEFTNVINKSVNNLITMPISDFAKSSLEMMKDFSPEGVKDFFIEELKIGGFGMMSNLDMIKNTFEDIKSYPASIVEGLVTNMCLNSVNRIWTPLTQSAQSLLNNFDLMNELNPFKGIKIDSRGFMNTLTGSLSGYLNNIESKLTYVFQPSNLIDSISNGTFKDFFKDISKSATPNLKRDVLRAFDNLIEDNVTNVSIGELLGMKSQVNFMPKYSRDESMRLTNLPRSQDNLGAFIKNLENFDLSSVPTHTLSAMEKAIFDKTKLLQQLSKNVEYASRGTTSGSFAGFGFDSIWDIYTKEELGFIAGKDPVPEASRWNGMPPTVEVFIREDSPKVVQRSIINPF